MVLLAGGFVLTVCAMQAQTAARQRVTSPGGVPSAEAAKIRQDEARLTGILARNPEDAGALAGMGWVRSRQRNYTAAVSYLERALRRRPGDTKLKFALDEARFRVMMDEAEHARAAGDAEAARRFYLGALAIRPSPEASQGVRAAAGVEHTAGGVQ
jgi:cytochrome c-type biogenesis protein CcmH/NrfG